MAGSDTGLRTEVETQRKEIGAFGAFVTWALLVGLTTISYLITVAHLGEWGFGIALVIGAVKAVLVAGIFMQLFAERFTTRIILIVVALFIVILVTMVTLDPLTRHTFPPTPEPPPPAASEHPR